jgi:hypothetical protein
MRNGNPDRTYLTVIYITYRLNFCQYLKMNRCIERINQLPMCKRPDQTKKKTRLVSRNALPDIKIIRPLFGPRLEMWYSLQGSCNKFI